MKYLLLCCIDEHTFEAMPKSQCDAFMDGLSACCDQLKRTGHLIAAKPLESVEKAVTLRGRAGEGEQGDERHRNPRGWAEVP